MSQEQQVLAYLKRHGTITPKEAWVKLGIYRLAARIERLRHQHTIKMLLVKVGERTHHARYLLVS